MVTATGVRPSSVRSDETSMVSSAPLPSRVRRACSAMSRAPGSPAAAQPVDSTDAARDKDFDARHVRYMHRR